MRTFLSRPALLAMAALAVLGPVAACGQAGTPAGGSVPTERVSTDAGAGVSTTAHGVRLDATFSVDFPVQPTGPGMRKRPGVVVTYSLTRVGTPGTEAGLVAYDVVPDSLGSASLAAGVNPEHAWVYADGATVRISKQGFATAPGVAFAAAPTMGARLVPTDTPLQGRAYAVTPPELSLPGREFVAPRTAIEAGSSSFSFCVQVGEKAGGMRPSSVEGVLQAPVRAPEGDELVCTNAVTLTTP